MRNIFILKLNLFFTKYISNSLVRRVQDSNVVVAEDFSMFTDTDGENLYILSIHEKKSISHLFRHPRKNVEFLHSCQKRLRMIDRRLRECPSSE